MLRLFIKDNTNGQVHEYGTSPHDALILQEDGSLHYENLQCFGGTKYPEEGYSFCLYQGTVPPLDDPEIDPYIDIAGEYYARPQTNADCIRAMSDEELANFFADKCLMASYLQLTDAKYNLTATEIEAQKHTAFSILMKWLQMPAEVTDNAD